MEYQPESFFKLRLYWRFHLNDHIKRVNRINEKRNKWIPRSVYSICVSIFESTSSSFAPLSIDSSIASNVANNWLLMNDLDYSVWMCMTVAECLFSLHFTIIIVVAVDVAELGLPFFLVVNQNSLLQMLSDKTNSLSKYLHSTVEIYC